MADDQLRVALAHNLMRPEVMGEVEANQNGFVFSLIIRCLEGEL